MIERFLSNFAKKTFTTNDQVKIIGDFLHVCVDFSVRSFSLSNRSSLSQTRCETQMCGGMLQTASLIMQWKEWRNWS